MQLKQEREAEFHNTAFSSGLRDHVSKFYLILDSCHGFYRNHLREHCREHDVLELGCGQDSNAVFMMRNGARRVMGIDISSVAIEQGLDYAAQQGVAVDLRVMDAEKLEFPDASFDLICGVAILHHLDLAKVLPELARTLRPGGTAVFLEPLAHNPVINLYRRMTPKLRTPDEHPLSTADLKNMENYFGKIEKRYFHLLSLAAAPFHKMPAFDKVVHLFDSSDRALFSVAPFMRRYAWTVGLIFSKPVKP